MNAVAGTIEAQRSAARYSSVQSDRSTAVRFSYIQYGCTNSGRQSRVHGCTVCTHRQNRPGRLCLNMKIFGLGTFSNWIVQNMDKLRCNTLKVTDWQRYCNIAPWTGWLEPHWIVCSLSQKSTDPALGYKTINTRIVLKLFPCNYGHRTPVRDDVSLLLWVSRWYTRRGIAVPSNSLSPAAPQAHKALSRVARVARLSMLQALYPYNL